MPWDPTRDLLTMQERLESLFGQAKPGWVPPVDVAEFEDRYVVTIELPGLKRSDVRIDLAGATLTVSGSRNGQPCCPERYQRLERGQGAFSRSFRFTAPIRSDAVQADLSDGVLTIVAPKDAPDRRRIEVD